MLKSVIKRKCQRGYALAIMLALLVSGALLGIVHSLNAASLRAQQTARTSQALQEAKEAIIADALLNSNPGRLPCPENTSLIGLNTEGSSGSCGNTSISLGRLPWRSLKLAQFPDQSNEQLWYAVSPGFRSGTINASTPGKLTLNGVAVAAIIFAPGIPINTQSRPTPTVLLPPLPANYLDGTNADGDVSFSSNAPSINDLAIGITVAELTAPIAKRVLAEIAGPNVNGAPPGDTPAYGLRRYYAENSGSFPATQSPSTLISSLVIDAAANWINTNGWVASLTYSVNGSGATLTLNSQSLLVKPCLSGQPCP